MHPQQAYPYAPSTGTTSHRYASTSSAFSASANPNEDWTKISDLAERRRIQNRIAQRNYRKKLKKRLEDLERRAASNSASPEQRPAELQRPSPPRGGKRVSSQRTPDITLESSPDYGQYQRHASEGSSQSHYLSAHDDRSMFAHQYTRQLSTSPPPVVYPAYPAEEVTYATYPSLPYATVPATASDYAMFPGYTTLPPPHSSMNYAQKHELYSEEQINPFGVSYASMAGIDISTVHSYPESNPHVIQPHGSRSY